MRNRTQAVPTRSPRLRRATADRRGAVLLDLFLATLIFTVCVIALGQLGSQSLQTARMTAVERLAALEAESILAKEITFGPHSSPKTWNDSLQGIPFTVRTTWNETELPRLQRITVDVATANDQRSGRTTASLSRLVLIGEGN